MHEYADEDQVGRDDTYIDIAAEIFAMLADPTRIRLVLALRNKELSVGSLTTIVDRSQPSVSHHLAKLRMARMVTTRQDGNQVYYRLASDHTNELARNAMFHAANAIG